MKKYKMLSVLIIFLIFPAFSVFAFAQKEHNEMFEKTMFGDYDTVSKEKQKLIEDASYLCIDQFNGNGEGQLYNLKKAKVKGLPKRINEIDFYASSYHRRFTHKGWDFTYIVDKAKWSTRKSILKNTVKKVFPKGNETEIDCISALVYYIHILGDHKHIKENYVNDGNLNGCNNRRAEMIDFAQAHPSESNPDICYEIEKDIELLFKRKKTDSLEFSMEVKLKKIHEKASKIANYSGGLVTDLPGNEPGTRIRKYYMCVDEYLKVLEYELAKVLDPIFKEFL